MPIERKKPFIKPALLPLCVVAFMCSMDIWAQRFAMPMDEFGRMELLCEERHMQPDVHTGMQPVFLRDVEGFDRWDGLLSDSLHVHSRFRRKLFQEHTVRIDQEGLRLIADPIMDFAYGRENRRNAPSDRLFNPLYTNTRGIAISAYLGEAVYVYTDFTENQARFPSYISEFIAESDVVMGSGRVKPFGENGYDYSMVNGYIGWEVNRFLSLQAGHFKHFVGHGRRSLLLSDNAFNYPFASYELSLWGGRVKYRQSIALLQSLDRLPLGATPESLFKRKYMSYSYLSVKPVPSLEIGFYESVMWPYFREGQGRVPFNFASLNPLIYTNSLALGLDDPERNAMVGLNACWQPVKHLRIFGQFMQDRSSSEGRAFQAGTEVYGIWKRLSLMLEYNSVPVSSYQSEIALQSYTHFNQALGHTLGSGFDELMLTITYYHRRIFAQAQWMEASLHEGMREIALSPGSNPSSQASVSFQDINVAYILNERSLLQVYAGYTNRLHNTTDGLDFENNFWYIGLRSRLQRTYRNF